MHRSSGLPIVLDLSWLLLSNDRPLHPTPRRISWAYEASETASALPQGENRITSDSSIHQRK